MDLCKCGRCALLKMLWVCYARAVRHRVFCFVFNVANYVRFPPPHLSSPHLCSQVRFAEHGGQLKEAIVAAASDVAAFPGMQEGVYLVGTGSTGLAPTFATLGVGYFTGR